MVCRSTGWIHSSHGFARMALIASMTAKFRRVEGWCCTSFTGSSPKEALASEDLDGPCCDGGALASLSCLWSFQGGATASASSVRDRRWLVLAKLLGCLRLLHEPGHNLQSQEHPTFILTTGLLQDDTKASRANEIEQDENDGPKCLKILHQLAKSWQLPRSTPSCPPSSPRYLLLPADDGTDDHPLHQAHRLHAWGPCPAQEDPSFGDPIG